MGEKNDFKKGKLARDEKGPIGEKKERKVIFFLFWNVQSTRLFFTCKFYIQHCFVSRPSDFIVSEDAAWD